MKKTLLNFFLLASVTPFLIQCAAQTDVDDLRYQLRIVNKKLEDMKANTVDQLQKRQAMASGQVDQVELDILEAEYEKMQSLLDFLSELVDHLFHQISLLNFRMLLYPKRK